MKLSKSDLSGAYMGSEVAADWASISAMDISDEAMYPCIAFEAGVVSKTQDFNLHMLSVQGIVCRVEHED